MIVVDIETSGLYPEKHGIWQIGALDFYNPDNYLLDEARIDDEDEVSEGALKITGKTEIELRDKDKQSQKQLIKNFFNWTKTAKIRNALCQNPLFDVSFINYKSRKYGIKNDFSHLDQYAPFHYRSFDLHSFASAEYHRLNNSFLIKENYSNMGLSNILKFCGLEDNRKAHNALEDAKLTAESFSRLIYGKSLLKEFSQYKLPEYLTK